MTSLQSRLALMLGLIQGEKAYAGPPYIILDVIRRCNIHCTGCFFHCKQKRKPMPGNPDVQSLSFELVERICQDIHPLGTQEIFLLGEGEPFLHPHLMDFIHAFKSAKFKVHVFTNGTLFSKKNIGPLLESGLDVLNVTFWAANEFEHSFCHPDTSSSFFENRLQGVKLLTAEKRKRKRKLPIINLHMPINRSNFRNLEGRVELAAQVRCDSVSLSFFRDRGGEFEQLMLSSSDFQSISNDLCDMQAQLKARGISMNSAEYLAHARLGPNAWREVPCYAGWFTSYIKSDGTIVPCAHCYFDVGNMLEQSFATIWNGPQMREFRRKGIRMKRTRTHPDFCDCANCCQVKDNLKVDRIFKWVNPLIPRQNG
jgi:MoaA/NifB/PqqE/SkfB family radical SAM enzyme